MLTQNPVTLAIVFPVKSTKLIDRILSMPFIRNFCRSRGKIPTFPVSANNLDEINKRKIVF